MESIEVKTVKKLEDQGQSYNALNAMINMTGPDGGLQLEKDKEAARRYFLDHVNPNTVFFHTLKEKLDYLVENKYYEQEVLDMYSFKFIKKLFKRAYSYKFRFSSYLGAYTYYNNYTMKNFKGDRYLERYEDRVTMNALYLAQGDEKLAKKLVDEMMSGRYQPATPTFLNAGKEQRGELISCFPAGTPVVSETGLTKIENLKVGEKVLTHSGKYKTIEEVIINPNKDKMISITHYGDRDSIVSTPNHPFLIWTKRNGVQSIIEGDGANEEKGFYWVEAKDVEVGDFVVSSFPDEIKKKITYDLMDYASYDDTIVSVDSIIKKKNIDKKLRNKTPYSKSFVDVKQMVEENYDLGLILGWYLAEGYVSKRTKSNGDKQANGVHFTLGTHERDFQKELVNAIKSVFGIDAKVSDRYYDGSTKISIHSTVVGSFLDELLGTGFDKKQLPKSLILANHDFQEGLLHGVFRGDGHATNGSLALDMTNPELVESMKILVSRLGVLSRIRTYTSASGKITGQLVIPGLPGENEEFIYRVGKNLDNYVGLKGTGRNQKNSVFYKYIDGNICYEVKEVEGTDETPDTVFNLEVDGDHTYVVNGAVVHNCFLLRVEDNMESIGRGVNSSLQLSKRGGGVALDLSNLREAGAPIKNIEDASSGVVPVMKILEDSFSYANQLGARQGAGAVYLNAHHPDIVEFLDTKRENADEKIRIKTLSVGITIPDITFHLAKNNEDMYLFSPYDVEREYGMPFTEVDITKEYYNMVENEKIGKKVINPRRFFSMIAELQMESGYPYLMFVDNVNEQHPLDGKVTMSNLCVTGDTEILTKKGYRKTRDLFETQENFDVVVDKRARDMNLESEGLSVEKSTKMFNTAKDADILKLSTKEGFSLRATPWHKMYIKRDEELVKIPLKDVVPGDEILVQQGEGSFGEERNVTLAYLAGAITADGTIAEVESSAGNKNSSTKLFLYDKKKELAGKIEKLSAKVLEKREDLLERQSTLTPKYTRPEDEKWGISSAPLAKLLKEYGVTQESKLRVPDFVKHGDRDTQIAYLSGLYTFDGSITGSGPSIQLASVNKGLLKEVQKLLINLGIYGRIYDGYEETSQVMPGPKGKPKEYVRQTSWRLYVNGKRDGGKLFDLLEWGSWQEESMKNIVNSYKSDKVYDVPKFFSTVSSVEEDGVEDVYDVTVENGHSVIFNGIATGQCTEIFQRSTPSEYNPDLSYKKIGEDISCNLGSLNIAKVMDGEDFANTIETSMRALTAVSDLSNIDVVPSIAQGNDKSHAVGLGAMNLHGYLAREEIHYDSPEALDFTNLWFLAVNYQTIKASNKIAKERGESFEGFEDSDYYNGKYFEKYINENWGEIKTDKVRELVENSSLYIPTQDDWKKLAEEVRESGMYHAYRQAVAPTGSVSYLADATSSIHPITQPIEARKTGKTGLIYRAAPYMNDDNIEYYKDAYMIGPNPLIDVYAAATKHVDQGLSMTLFFYGDVTTREMNQAYIRAWVSQIKSIYYSRMMNIAVDGTQVDGMANDFCVSCMI